ncbi:MAG: glycerophosphodiester phosphodiesterase [Acidimicrobiales bacterium]
MKILAHRGAHEPEHPGVRENTLEAFELAAGLGIDGVEFDVRRSADRRLVVHHDPAIPDGRVIADTAGADLPEWVPGLDAVLDLCAGMSVIDIELKNSPLEPNYDADHGVGRAVAEVTQSRGLSGAGQNLLVSSFNLATLDAFRLADGATRTGWLTLPAYDQCRAAHDAARKGHCALHPPVRVADAETVDVAHGLGLEVVVWTVNDPEQMESMAGLGVDVMVTDYPALAVRVLGRMS